MFTLDKNVFDVNGNLQNDEKIMENEDLDTVINAMNESIQFNDDLKNDSSTTIDINNDENDLKKTITNGKTTVIYQITYIDPNGEIHPVPNLTKMAINYFMN